jgi:hypothetical protein
LRYREYTPASEESGDYICFVQYGFLGSKALPKVLALVLGKYSFQVVTQRAQRLAVAVALVTARDDGSYPWNMANIGAHPEGKRKASGWHGKLDSICAKMELGGQQEMVEREAQKVCTHAQAAELSSATAKKIDVGQIRTDAPEGTRFLVLRDNHSVIFD